MATAQQKKDPLQSANQDEKETEKQAQRFLKLHEEDAQFRDCMALEAVNTAKTQAGLRLAEVVKTVMEGYAERPALGRRVKEYITDPESGRTTSQLLPEFETISYAELWQRACALASDWHANPSSGLQSGNFVCVLGFASIDYACHILAGIHLGAVLVPLQTSAPSSNYAAILAETEASIFASSIEYLDKAVDAITAGYTPQRLVIFDYDERDDEHRDLLAAAQEQLAQAKCSVQCDLIDDLVKQGKDLPSPPLFVPPAEEDPLAWLFYTSGTTGTPKGAMFPQSLVINTWLLQMPLPAITLSFMPMSHLVGNGFMLMSLSCGGTSYCSPKSDLSTLFEDFSLVRPTLCSLVPRVCEMLYQHYLRELDQRIAAGTDEAQAEQDIKREMREQLLGGRLFSAGTGSAALAPEIYEFMKSMLDMHVSIGYASTEIGGGTVLIDGKVQRPLVIDYKLADVPELGYFTTDKPYPRGELLVKTSQFMGGYFKRPELTAERIDEEGFYRTGDVMAELGPDHLTFVDRANNVIKLSQGEFVAVAKLEAVYSQSELIKQIYIYGTSERAYLLAVVVPTDEATNQFNTEQALTAAIRQSMQKISEQNGLNGYEIPRDFILEQEAFSHKNGLLSEIGKHLRPKLKERYAGTLEQLYSDMAQAQVDELRALRTQGREAPVLDTVIRAMKAILGIDSEQVTAEDRFIDLGGDSLTALEFSKLLEDIFAIEVSVGTIINPAGNIKQIATQIGQERDSGVKRSSFRSIHGDSTTITASDLKLDKFIPEGILLDAAKLPPAKPDCQHVLLTGATGYLGRFLALAWLEQLAKTGGKLTLVARGSDNQQARARIDQAMSSDPDLAAHFNTLAEKHLEVIAGDLGSTRLGLTDSSWNDLCDNVDVIVHCGAHVNHVLPYQQLFAANVLGTAELISLALTSKRKRIHYISTLGVSMLCDKGLVDEHSDIRDAASKGEIKESYANGYNLSKWASEVLLREAHAEFDLPVSVFRPGMILAHSHYRGQLNVPDMFTRLLYSLAKTGVAPATFYAEDLSQGRPAGRYEGFTVDFLAEAFTAIGLQDTEGFHSYNASSPYQDGSSLDDFVDWMKASGCQIEHVAKYSSWLPRFETAMQAMPEEEKSHSLLALLQPYQQPQIATAETLLASDRFCQAAQTAGLEVPPLSEQVIQKYINDLIYLNLL